ncbi:ATP-binding cassette sub-family G member [Ooceraea biroi]|nr:ATP-binding cassette sub-family G member [Ooceraea biroi]
MQYTSVSLNATRAVDIHFKDLSYQVQIRYRGPKKQILKGLNGVFKCGELTAIMGPSGAGKSSLLNILTGFQEENLLGTMEYISRQGKLDRKKCKKLSCYVQQADNMYGLLTIQESMMLASCLKIASITQKRRQTLIDDILDTLNLSKAKNTRVDRLSGGQKKRLSIALELIDNPPIMFLDEPTSGLDSLASSQCIAALQTLAKSGRAIICTIHQPSAALYHMFDYIYLIADGHCMYADVPNNTINYFAKQGFQCPKYHNPADYMLEVVNQEYGNYNNQLVIAAKKYCQRDETPLQTNTFTKSGLSFANDREGIAINPPSEMMRFRVLLRRCVLLLYRDWTTTYIKMFFHFLVALLLGLLYMHAGADGSKTISNVSFMFFTVVYIAYTSMMPAVLRFPLEMDILRKERFNNWYQLKTYYITTIITTFPLQVFFCLLYSGVSYVLTGQPMEWFRYYRFLLIVILTSISAESMGIGFGAIFDPVNGTFIGSIVICTLLCFIGFLIFLNHMPIVLYYVSYINYLRYAFEGLLQSVYGYHREKLSCPSSAIYCHYRMPSAMLEELNMIKPMFWIDVAVLFIYFVFFRLAAYIVLKRRLTKLW